jgi:16S rRNA (uracil1498-N3)-methyltransferase
MPRFFTDNINGKTAFIEGEDARHIAKSLRMRPGDRLTLCDTRGTDHACSIAEILAERITVQVLESRPTAAEPRHALTLFQALPKAGKLEAIAQKAVELGAAALVPVSSANCVARWPENGEPKKRERLDKIMLEAAKQCGRGIIPRTEPLLRFEEAVPRMKEAELAIMFYEDATRPLRDILAESGKTARSIAIMIGSEGGFTPQEAAFAEENGVPLASLGARILRCETAPVCAISAINYALGEF